VSSNDDGSRRVAAALPFPRHPTVPSIAWLTGGEETTMARAAVVTRSLWWGRASSEFAESILRGDHYDRRGADRLRG
jgi:hypothetical protein